MEEQLREQIMFEQWVNSFYLDLVYNHITENDGYSQFVLELIKEIKKNAKDAKEANSQLKNLPGIIKEKIANGEIKDLLNL